jgi:uncharacterized membrane protein (DUF106 family)
MQPFEAVFLYGLGLSLITFILYILLINVKDYNDLKNEMNDLKKKINDAQKQKDLKKANDLTNDMLKASSKQFKMSMKPLIVSMFIAILSLGYMNSQYAKVLINLPFNAPIAGTDIGWLWWYILVSVSATTLFRKIAGLD